MANITERQRIAMAAMIQFRHGVDGFSITTRPDGTALFSIDEFFETVTGIITQEGQVTVTGRIRKEIDMTVFDLSGIL